MSDAAWLAVVVVGFFILRGIAITLFFLYILPQGDRCPNCDEPTLRVQSRMCSWLLHGFRSSWCPRCGWEGLLRRGPLTPAPRASQATHSR
jgi:hypothetical protein